MQKILLVDDEKSFIDIIEILLKKEDYEVVVAHDGVEAMRIVQSDHPDLISAYETIKSLVEQYSNPFPGNVLVRHYSNAYRAQDIHIMDGPRLPAPN